jgi:hypothetical protein
VDSLGTPFAMASLAKPERLATYHASALASLACWMQTMNASELGYEQCSEGALLERQIAALA